MIVGVDIGGANLKFADESKRAHSHFFPMWRQPDMLQQALEQSLRGFGAISALAVVMTGELADCFVDRAQGVAHITAHARQAASQLGIRSCYFYGVDGMFHQRVGDAHLDCLAAANWHALASFVGREVCGDALLIDVGSTTTDLVPIRCGGVTTQAMTDHDRLGEGSLAYVGCQRTPVAALCTSLRYQNQSIPVMKEVFATIDDARVVLGLVAESATDLQTADGRPRTKPFALNRLARMIGLDRRRVSVPQARDMAAQVLQAAQQTIADSIDRVRQTHSFQPPAYVICGHGNDLLRLPDDVESISLAERLGPEISRSAPSYAVAMQLRHFLDQRSDDTN
ncbi:MAG: hydantoinase/oxoprolinase family protein [Novipirellula sp. JB048]